MKHAFKPSLDFFSVGMEGLDNDTQDPVKLPTASLRSNSLLSGSKWQGIGEFRM